MTGAVHAGFLEECSYQQGRLLRRVFFSNWRTKGFSSFPGLQRYIIPGTVLIRAVGTIARKSTLSGPAADIVVKYGRYILYAPGNSTQ